MLLIQITAARGPAECERAVQLTLRECIRDAASRTITLDVLESAPTPAGFKSVLLGVQGEGVESWLATWEGSVQWIFNSPFRPGHRRRNWFVGVQRCVLPADAPDDDTITFQPCRASGKGGQHVNTTDSAVHAIHAATGIAVKVGSERSQFANKRLARTLIAMKLAAKAEDAASRQRRERSQQHDALERGNPVRTFSG